MTNTYSDKLIYIDALIEEETKFFYPNKIKKKDQKIVKNIPVGQIRIQEKVPDLENLLAMRIMQSVIVRKRQR